MGRWVWFRYVDDVVKRIHNSYNPSIQFTLELQDEDKDGNQYLPSLDLDIQRLEDGTSKLKIYRKSTYTDQYLTFNSHYPLHQKLGVVRILLDRANTLITTTEEDSLTEISNIKGAL